MNLPWNEYWEFLKCYCNFKSDEGQYKLEIYFKQKILFRLFDFQARTINALLDECDQENNCESGEMLRNKLHEFTAQIEKLKETLDLKDSNSLCSKFERFLSLIERNPFDLKSTLPFKFVASLETSAEADELTLAERLINVNLNDYMNLAIDLSKLDSSGRCYFSLYKTAKRVVEIFRCKELFDVHYLSPVYKNFAAKKSEPPIRAAAVAADASQTFREEKRRDRRLDYDSDNDDDDDESKDEIFDAAEDSMLDYIGKTDDDEIEQLAEKLNMNRIDENKIVIKVTESKDDDDEYELNRVDNKRYDVLREKQLNLANNSNNSSSPLVNNKQRASHQFGQVDLGKLFIFG